MPNKTQRYFFKCQHHRNAKKHKRSQLNQVSDEQQCWYEIPEYSKDGSWQRNKGPQGLRAQSKTNKKVSQESGETNWLLISVLRWRLIDWCDGVGLIWFGRNWDVRKLCDDAKDKIFEGEKLNEESGSESHWVVHTRPILLICLKIVLPPSHIIVLIR